uniref:Uncharacterized protein n=1 Tax=Neospora caninum (strain Liverpool) TaxID=572307 RepID=A0A0F7UKL4_NEOCL|nr:TPA: hypothetical protein BN1204_044345 [Neospora caninum Liverpool]
MADYRPCLHQAVNLHMGRLVSSYSSFLDCCSVNEEGNLCGMTVDNFLLKLQVFAIIHSCRSLLTLAADCAVNTTLHDTQRLFSLLTESQKNLRQRIAALKSAERGKEASAKDEERTGYGDTDAIASAEGPRTARALPFLKSEGKPQFLAFDDLLGSFFHQRDPSDSEQHINVTQPSEGVTESEEQGLEAD